MVKDCTLGGLPKPEGVFFLLVFFSFSFFFFSSAWVGQEQRKCFWGKSGGRICLILKTRCALNPAVAAIDGRHRGGKGRHGS